MKKKIAILLFIPFLTLTTSCDLSSLISTHSLVIASLPNKTTYLVGEAISYEGLVVHNEKGEEVTNYHTSREEGSYLTKAGEEKITITKTSHRSTYFTVSVYEDALTNVKKEAKKTISETYNNYDFNLYDEDGKAQLLKIKNEALIKIDNAQSEQEIAAIIEETISLMEAVEKASTRTLVSISITQEPNKKEYYQGDTNFNYNGLIVVACYDDGTSFEIDNYEVTDPDTSSLGSATVVVTYQDFSDSFLVTIIEKPSESGLKSLKIYATNDIHGQVYSDDSRAGMLEVGSYLKQMNKEDNVLILDQGDTWQGSIYSNYNYGALISDVMNYVGYDARTIGNHDFDWGTSHLIENTARSYEGYKTPTLAANVYDFDFVNKKVGNNQQSDIGIKSVSYTMENGLKVGIVGTIGRDQITSISSVYTQNIAFINHIDVIKEEATKLRNEGCDLIISCTHADEDSLIGNNLDNYIDLQLCAHSHQYETYNEGSLYYGQFGSYNQNVGIIDITYDMDTKTVQNTNISSISGWEIKEQYSNNYDAKIKSIIDAYASECNEVADEVVASNATGSFYSSEQLPNLMCKAVYEQALKEGYEVDFAYCNQGRGSLYSNAWTYADLYRVFPFDNEVYIMDITYSELQNEVLRYNNIYVSPNFNGSLTNNRTYKIACLDYLAVHTNSSRYYDYFPESAGKTQAVLKNNYRVILKDYLKNNHFNDGRELNANSYKGDVSWFSKNLNSSKVKVNFYMNDGTSNLYYSHYAHSDLSILTSMPEKPYREGYVFMGWYLNAACTDSRSVTYGEHQNYYAKWENSGFTEEKGLSIDDPFTTSEAIQHINMYGDNGNIYYVKGMITSDVVTGYNNKIKFTLDDIFQAYYVSSSIGVPTTGETVIICGQLCLYNGSIYETTSGTGELVWRQ